MMSNTQAASVFYFREGSSRSKIMNILEASNVADELDGLKPLFKKDSLTFVGIYTFSTGDNCYCYPKYFPEVKSDEEKEKVKKHMELVANVIEKLRQEGKNMEEESQSFSPYHNQSTPNKVNRIELARYIIKDYLEHGLFYIDEKRQSINGNGRTHWTKTVNRLHPIINGNDIIYFNRIVQSRYTNYDTLITEIHGHIVSKSIEAMNKLGYSLGVNKPTCSKATIDLESMVPYIEQMLSQLFEERQVCLFKAMISWCKESRYYKFIGGTTNFAGVWEWVNDAVWGNVSKKDSSNPMYYLGDFQLEGKGEAKPDTLYISDISADSTCNIFIYDSKYYVVKSLTIDEQTSTGSILGFPANADIIKQIAYKKFIAQYFESINNILQDNKKIKFKFKNMFLIPELLVENKQKLGLDYAEQLTNLYQKIGTVSAGVFDGLLNSLKIDDQTKAMIKKQESANKKNKSDQLQKEDLVEVLEVNPEILYRKYLSSEKCHYV